IECRVPFLDYRLVETLASLPSSVLFAGRGTKRLLRASLGHRLPPAVLLHPKWGFGVPWNQYLSQSQDLRQLLLDLTKEQLLLDSPFELAKIKDQVHAFLKGDDRPFQGLRQILMTVIAYNVVAAHK